MTYTGGVNMTRKTEAKKLPLHKKLQSIQKTIGTTVLFKIGIRPGGHIDIVDMKSFPPAEQDEDLNPQDQPQIEVTPKRVNYIG